MDRLRVGIDQKLIGVEPFAAFGLVGAVDAIPVELPEFYAGNVTVPDKPRTLADGDNLGHFGAAILEETQLDRGRLLRVQREVDAGSVPSGTLRVRLAGKNCAGHLQTRERARPLPLKEVAKRRRHVWYMRLIQALSPCD